MPTQVLAFLAVFVYATHATQAIAFEWKPGLTPLLVTDFEINVVENVEEFVGPLFDLTEVDDHVVDIDRYVQAEHVFERLLRAAKPLERVVDKSL